MQEVIPPTPDPTPPPAPTRKRRMSGGLIAALSAVLLGLFLLCGVGAMLICQTFEDGCSIPFAASPEPTPTSFPPQSVPPPDSNVPLISVAIGEQTVQLSPDPPSRLSAAGEDFAVQVGGVGADGRWNPVVGSDKVAVWLNGTVINYVMAVQDTESNRTLMQSLERGQVMSMVTESGRELEFDFSSREIVPITKLDIFGQTSPGITVVLVRNDEAQDRMIVRGRYKVGEAVQSIAPGASGGIDGATVAELGEVVQLGDIQLVVNAFDSRPVAGGNFSYFLVDYQIQNNGQIPLEAGALQFTLVDSVGSQYALSLDASQIGNFQPIPQSLGVGQPLQATAGYQVPNGLDPTALGWVVKRLDTGEQIEIRASRAVAGEVQEISADITLDSAELVANASSMRLRGAILNNGSTPLVIDANDVTLDSDGTAYAILSTKPAFPWIIAPGAAEAYELTVPKPIDSSVVTFTILGSSWQLDNFR